jgi:hypothetical protein
MIATIVMAYEKNQMSIQLTKSFKRRFTLCFKKNVFKEYQCRKTCDAIMQQTMITETGIIR